MGATPLRDDDLIACAETTIRIQAQQIVRNNGNRFGDKKDVEQELKLYLLKRKHKYDPQRGALVTFVATVIESGVKELYRNADRIKRKPPSHPRSLDETVRDREGNDSSLDSRPSFKICKYWPEIGEGYLADIGFRASFNEAMANLPPKLQEAVEYYRGRCGELDTPLKKRSKDWVKKSWTKLRAHFERYGVEIPPKLTPRPRANGIDNNQADIAPPDGDDL